MPQGEAGDGPALPTVRQAATQAIGEIAEIEQAHYRARFTSLGGGIASWTLRDYEVDSRDGRRLIELLTGEPPLEAALVTPFDELGLGDLSTAVFELEAQDDGELRYRLTRAGVTVRKIYELSGEGYGFRLRVEVDNASSGPVEPRFTINWPAQVAEGPDFTEQALVALHDGEVEQQLLAGIGRGGFFRALTGGRPQTVFDYLGDIDWAGVQTTYFLAVVLPDEPREASARFVAAVPGKVGVAQLFFDPVRIPPGQSAVRGFRGYIGPKEVDRLVSLGGETVRSINLGWSWIAPMTRFFVWLLGLLYAVIPNYGVGIVILTILVRVVTAPLVVRQMRSMERMRAIQPKLKEIQEKYKDDRQKQSEQMMSLYRSEGVNPLGGCLPMLLQLPVMIGLFYALRSSIQLRQAPFFGWIDDLSAPETLFEIPGLGWPVRVLPLIMGATMVLQQKIAPQQPTMDATQAKMMMTMMPIVMTVVFYQFASGLVLYWMLGNVLAILHQLWIRRRMAR